MDPQRRSRLLLLVIYLGFISLGLPDGTLGVAWPAVYPDLGLPLGLAGTLVTIGTLLTGSAGFASGWILARIRTGPLVVASGVLTATGLIVVSRSQGALWLYAAMVPLGLGAGAVDAALNGFVARHYEGRHMNWLHACWGVGATSGPIFMGWALAEGHGWRGGYLALGALQFTLAGLFLATLGLWERVPERPSGAGAGGAARVPTTPARSWAGWLSPAIFALYVAVEMTVGLWAGTVLIADRGAPPGVAAAGLATYYGMLTAGRVAVGFVVDRWGNRRLVNGGGALAAAGLAGFALADGGMLAVVALGVTGLGLAPTYPGLMHEVPRRFAPEAVLTVIGRQAGAANLGAAVLPALAGLLAQHALGAVPWLALAVLLVMLAGIRRLDRIT